MANQYVANTLVGIDVPDAEAPSGVKTAWYEHGEVLEGEHADALGEENLKAMVNGGSLKVNQIKDKDPAAAKQDAPKDPAK